MNTRILKWLLALLLAVGAGSTPSHALTTYTVTDLGTLGGDTGTPGTYSRAQGINTAGVVVGSSKTAFDADEHAFKYESGTMTDMGTLTGGLISYAYGINTGGVIVGQSDVGAGVNRAFKYESGTMIDLGTLGGSNSTATAINTGGVIVGQARNADDNAHAFKYESGTMTDLETLGGTYSGALGINTAGVIVGQSAITGDAGPHAFKYESGTMTDLGTLGGNTSAARGINTAGVIVGYAYTTTSGSYHAFKYESGTMTDLETLGGTTSAAYSINTAGVIVGQAKTAGNTDHAFKYESGNMTDLNSVLDPLTGANWILEIANAINDSGKIVGSGTHNGALHAFLLTPIGANTAPVAVADAYSTDQDVTLTVTAALGVLENDTDADAGDTLTAIKVSDPTHGTLTLNADGSFVYIPTGAYHGSDSFTYKANDGTADSNVATVTLTVNDTTPGNVAPVAVADAYSTDQDVTLTVTAALGVLKNDTDADAGNALTAIKVSNPTHGTLTLNADGSFVYIPTGAYHGSDSFTYKANDGKADSNTTTVSLTVNPVSSENTAPVLDPIGNKTINELIAFSFMATATDAEHNVLTFSLQNAPQGASINATTGQFSWTPTEAQGPGSYTFKVRVSDGTLTDEEQITITVREGNSAPLLDLGGNRTVTGGVPFSFGISASDPDVPKQTLGVYPIAPTPSWVGLTNGPTIFGTAPVSNAPYTVTVAIRAGDNFGATTDKSIQLTVNPAPVAASVTWTVQPTWNATEGTLTYRLKNTTNKAITGVYVSGHFRVAPKSVASNIGTTSWNNQGNGYYGVYWSGFNVAPGQEKVLTVKVARPSKGRQVADTLYCYFGPNPVRTLATPGVNAP